MTHISTVAIVTNKYGDPEGFAERDLEICDNFQSLAIGTNLIERRHLDELQAKFDALYELAVQANQNCATTANHLRRYRTALANICLDWCTNIDVELKAVGHEDV